MDGEELGGGGGLFDLAGSRSVLCRRERFLREFEERFALGALVLALLLLVGDPHRQRRHERAAHEEDAERDRYAGNKEANEQALHVVSPEMLTTSPGQGEGSGPL
jgi:hypothetical protein